MGFLDNIKHQRAVREAEAKARREEELKLAPETGRIKAQAREKQIRANAKSGKQEGFLEKMARVNKAGEAFGTMMVGTGNYGTSFMDEISRHGSPPAHRKRIKKDKDPYDLGFGY